MANHCECSVSDVQRIDSVFVCKVCGLQISPQSHQYAAELLGQKSDCNLTFSITFDPPLEQIEASLDRLRDKMRVINEEFGQAMGRFAEQMRGLNAEIDKFSRGGLIGKAQAASVHIHKDHVVPRSEAWRLEQLAPKQVQHPMDTDELVGFLNRMYLLPLTDIPIPVASKGAWTRARARITVSYAAGYSYTDEGLSRLEKWLDTTVRPRIVFAEGSE